MDVKSVALAAEKELKAVKTEEKLSIFHRNFLSKTGIITALLSGMKDIAPEKRAEFGASVNELKRKTEAAFFALQSRIKSEGINKNLQKDKLIDVTIPEKSKTGSLHPITIVTKELCDIFLSMGFVVEDGNEIETEFNNFDSVNMPADHPSRDMQDTFWLSNGQVLKTQTSAAQNRILRTYGGNLEKGIGIRAVFPGRCFRNENVDASHENTFFQLEGMVVDEKTSVSNLIYFMKTTLSRVFGKDLETRLRPGYFPFVEPGFELDIQCPYCGGVGCRVCKHSGWIELCPCGMIHPKVLELGGVDSKKYTGFAFGLGLTRLAMMKFSIKEIKMLNSGNLEFLEGM